MACCGAAEAEHARFAGNRLLPAQFHLKTSIEAAFVHD
jgi:hypothetical protein